jgi:hypothetical protein
MSDWSKDIAARFRRASEERAIANRKSLLDTERRTELLGQMWLRVVHAIEQGCVEINEEKCGISLKCDTSSTNVVVSRLDAPATIEGTYNPAMFAINFSGIETNRKWSNSYIVKLTMNGQDCYIDRKCEKASTSRSDSKGSYSGSMWIIELSFSAFLKEWR